jgi:hypothetical protein
MSVPLLKHRRLLADRIAAVETAIHRAADPRHPVTNPVARHAAGADLTRL